MIVTCENCGTRFKFDERRIKPEGIKVHCSRCRRTFLLMPPSGVEPPIRGGQEVSWKGASTPEIPAAAEPEVARGGGGYDDSGFQEDDPLADVPGFDPDTLPALVNVAASEEEKALEALTRDEFHESSVSEALDRFGAAFKEGDGEGFEESAGDGAESPQDGSEGDPSPSSGDDPYQVDGLDDLAASSGSDPDAEALPAQEGDEAGDPSSAPADFDWEQVSFKKDTGPRGPGPAVEDAPAEVPGEGGEDDASLFIEPTTHPAAAPAAAASPASEDAAGAARKPLDSAPLELDLSGVSSKAAAQPNPAPAAAPAAGSAPAAPLETHKSEVAAPRKAKPVAIPPLRLHARVERASMPVPKLAALVLAVALGLTAAVAGAITAYAPYRGGSRLARPVGAVAGGTSLVIEDARGITIERLHGTSLYLVTGKARWDGAVAGPAYLEGVITEPGGRVLERRPARLGPLPDWKTIEAVDPDLFAPATALPPEGLTPFSLLFAPAPQWRGTVHFELVAAP